MIRQASGNSVLGELRLVGITGGSWVSRKLCRGNWELSILGGIKGGN